MFFFTSSFHILVELNENFRYETRLEKKKSFIVCLCFKCSAVHKENDTQTFEKEAWNYQAVQKTQTELVIRLSVSI